jgi:cytochrome c554/c'-like protein
MHFTLVPRQEKQYDGPFRGFTVGISALPGPGGTIVTTQQQRNSSIGRLRTKWVPTLLALFVGIGSCAHATGQYIVPNEKTRLLAESRNGPIFTDWTKPRVALLFSGEMNGYLEPCGCAGLENQKGGLKRRYSLIKYLRQQGWPVVPVDMGGQVKRFGPQANIKLRMVLQSLMELGYSGIAFGAHDLMLDTNQVLYVVANLDPETNPLVSANVALIDFESGFSSRYRVIKAGGKRIGVTSVLGKKYAEKIKSLSDIAWLDPVGALDEIAPKLNGEKCDWQVLMVHGDPEEAAQLARRYPQFQLVATTGGAEEPPDEARAIEGTQTRLIEVGHKGMYVVVVGLYDMAGTEDGPTQTIRYQRVPVDARFVDAPEMQEMLITYQKELETLGLEGLGLTGIKHSEDQFVGSSVCANCHIDATDKFLETTHSHATQTLVGLDPPRHHDPECLSCHVTGWNPQQFFPYSSGYMGLEKTPELRDNGCENCHGPGAAHAAAQAGEIELDESEMEKLRAAMRLTVESYEDATDGHSKPLSVAEKKCFECHDLDNSPDFDFEKYWPDVKHEGLE